MTYPIFGNFTWIGLDAEGIVEKDHEDEEVEGYQDFETFPSPKRLKEGYDDKDLRAKANKTDQRHRAYDPERRV